MFWDDHIALHGVSCMWDGTPIAPYNILMFFIAPHDLQVRGHINFMWAIILCMEIILYVGRH